MNNIPQVKLGIVAVSRDCFPITLSEKRRKAVVAALAAKGIPMAAATSSPRGHVTHALQRLGLLGYFAQIFTTGEIGVSKHEPTIYLLAAQALGSAPGETIVFEDSLYALKTAKAAGFYTVGVYDADGESDQAGLKAAADLYVKELGEAAGRW